MYGTFLPRVGTSKTSPKPTPSIHNSFYRNCRTYTYTIMNFWKQAVDAFSPFETPGDSETAPDSDDELNDNDNDNDETFRLEVAVPGIQENDVDGGSIAIQGHDEATTKNSRSSSTLEQTVSLESAVDAKKFVPVIDNGVPEVSDPEEQAKLAEEKVRKIPITNGGTKTKEELEKYWSWISTERTK
mmetsp:Transcript_3665/g.7882  ORF Transcript_3665/g.7882 Transcript_3665/m.7882 type:complete len:186 (-) Transcript_3665:97-654(-)